MSGASPHAEPSSCVALHCALLRRAGYMRAGASRIHAAYRALVLALMGVYIAQQATYAIRARHDLDEVVRVMFLMLCHVTALVKQLVLRANEARVDALVLRFDGMRRGARAAALESAVARRARRFVACYAGCAVLTCSLWLLFPLLERVRGLPVRFPFCTGVDTAPLPAFVAVLLYSFYVTTLVGITNTTMDAFMATILYQCKTQLTILRYNLETLPERAAREERGAGAGRAGDALMRLFEECYHHYHKVTQTAALFQDIFGGAILIQFGIGGWILCMAAYQLATLSALSIEFASMLLFLTCILLELFLYCYCGNELAVESGRIVWSAYAMSWERTPPRFRRCLVLLMERAHRPLRPAAGHVVPLSLDTYVKILKSSYSFYAVLRQTK